MPAHKFTYIVSNDYVEVKGTIYLNPQSTWGGFKKLCRELGFKYDSLRNKKFPVKTDSGHIIIRKPFDRKDDVYSHG